MPRYWWSIPFVLLAWLPIALADAPATQPSGGGAAGPTDVLRVFLQDIQHGNSADIVRVCSARGEDAKGVVRDFQAVASATEYLRTAVTLKFGPDAWASVLPSLPKPADLDDVTETITGDQAQLTGANISKVRMIRVQGSWKLDVDGLLQSDEAPANVHWFSALAQAMRRTADDITAGRLTTPAAAAEAMAAREQAIPDVPTTQPATRP
ncbi:MAG: hypothetical protein ABSB42_17470 [Tepidisphaeraceae bacterium]|jgi:hypothetical protein